jgi:hypothetical protein
LSAKAEKRLALKALKLEKTLAKTARQFESPALAKTISALPDTEAEKILPPIEVKPSHRLMEWSRDIEDVEGSWSWGQDRASGAAWASYVHPFLQNCATRYWYEIDSDTVKGKGGKRRLKHCYYAVKKIIDEAQERLVEIELDDFADQIFRFRMSGKKRVYGFRTDHTFFFVWYDPKHLIYSLN